MGKTNTTKHDIFMAAIECFSKKNYKSCSMKEIADRVGIKPSSIYKHYESKDQILDEIFRYYEHNFHKYCVPVNDVLTAAKSRPITKLLPMMFYRFGSNQEHDIMMQVAQIVLSMRYENERANDLYWKVQIDIPTEYLETIFFSLIMRGQMKPLDYKALSRNLVAFTELMLIFALSGRNDSATQEKLYVDGINMFAKMIECGEVLEIA